MFHLWIDFILLFNLLILLVFNIVIYKSYKEKGNKVRDASQIIKCNLFVITFDC